jgi:hypothetical protein
VKGREGTSENMVESFVGTSLFYGEEVSILFDDTDDILITLIIATIIAH